VTDTGAGGIRRAQRLLTVMFPDQPEDVPMSAARRTPFVVPGAP